MKKIVLGMTLGLLVALAVVVGAGAHGQRPPEPTCPEGQVTVSPAVWVPPQAEVTHQERRFYTEAEYACPVIEWTYGQHHVHVPYEKAWHDVNHCHRPSDWALQHTYGMTTHSERNAFKQAHPETLHSILVTPEGWSEWEVGTCSHGDRSCEERTVVDVPYMPGYWLPPVCRDPILGYEQSIGNDCQGWTVLEQQFIEGEPEGEPYVVASGVWSDPYELETASAMGIDPDGDHWTFRVAESGECLVACALTPLYRMYVLQDFDAPAGYLQGGTCYVISGSIPSVERQAAICTYPFCGSGWTYRADAIPYGGYVYRDCHGNAVYGWAAWNDDWLRHDFNTWGRSPESPRLPCCEGTGMGDLYEPSE